MHDTLRQAVLQVTCGSELAGLLVKFFTKDKVVADDQALLRLVRVLQAFPGPKSGSSDGQEKAPELCCKFAMEGVRWAREFSLGDLALQQDIAGSPEQQLHNHFARYLWDYYGPAGLGWASLHFAHGSEPFRFAAAIASAAEKAPASELDLFLVRAALQILGTNSSQCLIFCKEMCQSFRGILKQSERSLPDTPLVHFLDLLQEVRSLTRQKPTLMIPAFQPDQARNVAFMISAGNLPAHGMNRQRNESMTLPFVMTPAIVQALAQASLPLVQLLKEEYADALAVDDSLPMLLDQVLSRHFQMAPRGNMGGYLSQMLEMFNGFGQADE